MYRKGSFLSSVLLWAISQLLSQFEHKHHSLSDLMVPATQETLKAEDRDTRLCLGHLWNGNSNMCCSHGLQEQPLRCRLPETDKALSKHYVKTKFN